MYGKTRQFPIILYSNLLQKILSLKLRFPERKNIFHPWLRVSIQFYTITLTIQALSLVESQDLLEDRRTELRHN